MVANRRIQGHHAHRFHLLVALAMAVLGLALAVDQWPANGFVLAFGVLAAGFLLFGYREHHRT